MFQPFMNHPSHLNNPAVCLDFTHRVPRFWVRNTAVCRDNDHSHRSLSKSLIVKEVMRLWATCPQSFWRIDWSINRSESSIVESENAAVGKAQCTSVKLEAPVTEGLFCADSLMRSPNCYISLYTRHLHTLSTDTHHLPLTCVSYNGWPLLTLGVS